MKRRPKAPSGYQPDAEDRNTRTKYRGPEYCLGDSMKVILLQLYDIFDHEGLQRHEMLGLIDASIRLHIPGSVEYFEET